MQRRHLFLILLAGLLPYRPSPDVATPPHPIGLVHGKLSYGGMSDEAGTVVFPFTEYQMGVGAIHDFELGAFGATGHAADWRLRRLDHRHPGRQRTGLTPFRQRLQ